MTELLRSHGHDVRMVLDGPAALDLATSFRPTVVFLDVAMPGMHGYDVARRLRTLPAARHATLIALTGFGRDDDRQRAHDAGFDRHVTKPIDPTTLAALLGRGAVERGDDEGR